MRCISPYRLTSILLTIDKRRCTPTLCLPLAFSTLRKPLVAVSGAGDFAAGGFNQPAVIDQMHKIERDRALAGNRLADDLGDLLTLRRVIGSNFGDDGDEFRTF